MQILSDLFNISVFLALVIFCIGFFGLINSIREYIDMRRQDEVQEAWNIYSADMDVDNKLLAVLDFAIDYRDTKGWKCVYFPELEYLVNEFAEKGDTKEWEF